MESSSRFVCPLCSSFVSIKFHQLLCHIQLVHAGTPGFSITCGINGCQTLFKKMKTYRNHLTVDHMINFHFLSSDDYQPTPEALPLELPDNVDHSVPADTDGDEVYSNSEENDQLEQPLIIREQNPEEMVQKAAVSFILKIKELHKLSQTTVDAIIGDVTTLFQTIHGEMLSYALEKAVTTDADLNVWLPELFSQTNAFSAPFDTVKSGYLQHQYFVKELGMVEPRKITLGYVRKSKGRGMKRRCVDVCEEMIYVPLLDSIKQMMSSKSIQFENKLVPTEKQVCDFHDGSVFKSHPLFSIQPNALQVCLYYDDVEFCNPLGSKKTKHKLGIFYYSLYNLSKRQRFKIDNIQLLMLVKQKFIKKYSMNTILKPVVKDLLCLEKGVIINGKTVFGALVSVLADNPASSSIGGFKESSSARRPCRHCNILKAELSCKVNESQCSLRSCADYDKWIDEMNADPLAVNDLSVESGINFNSVLNQLDYFHVSSGCLLPDIFHDLLEGVFPFEGKLLLKHLILTKKYFTLSQLNAAMETIELGQLDSLDRPSPISHGTLCEKGHSLKQQGIQMWVLVRFLPLMIGLFVPELDPHWTNFIRLIDISKYLFSSSLDVDDISCLDVLITEHHQEFLNLYPDIDVIPKLHFLLHTPRLIMQYGPLVCHWTVRFEAKHRYFKQLTSSIKNFKNLPFSLANRHQQLQCYLINQNNTLSEVEFGPDCHPSYIYHSYCNESTVQHQFWKWVKIQGTFYERNCFVILNFDSSEEECVFGEIQDIFTKGSSIVSFFVQVYDTITYSSHYNCYIINKLEKFEVVCHSSLKSYLCLTANSIKCFPLYLAIVLKYII
jgi:hypothetical protein